MSMRLARRTLPATASLALLLAACGSSGDGPVLAVPQAASPGVAASTGAPADPTAKAAPGEQPGADAQTPARRSATAPSGPASSAAQAKTVPARDPAGVKATKAEATKSSPAPARRTGAAKAPGVQKKADAKAMSPADQQAYDRTGGATDMGVSKTEIKLGSVNMHGMAMANMITAPVVRGNLATITAINDRGGVLGRRLALVDCDDGPGDVARAKACIKKLVGQDKIFALITGIDWATASIHSDLREHKLPYVGAWAYSQTEWQDPYMFPTHMSMIHEAMAGAHWVKNVVKPKTYGLLCLTSPEMQISCDQVEKILDAYGAKLVKRVDVGINETTMSSAILAMRAAAPDHVIHYVISPVTVAKFILEATQQNYYPPQGISGNHLAAEVLGSVFGAFPAGRYWTNTTYKLWGSEFMATMNKYARGNKGNNNHIVQAGYVGINFLAQAAAAVGPNLTRETTDGRADQRQGLALGRLPGPEVLLRAQRAHRRQLARGLRPGPRIYVQVRQDQHHGRAQRLPRRLGPRPRPVRDLHEQVAPVPRPVRRFPVSTRQNCAIVTSAYLPSVKLAPAPSGRPVRAGFACSFRGSHTGCMFGFAGPALRAPADVHAPAPKGPP